MAIVGSGNSEIRSAWQMHGARHRAEISFSKTDCAANFEIREAGKRNEEHRVKVANRYRRQVTLQTSCQKSIGTDQDEARHDHSVGFACAGTLSSETAYSENCNDHSINSSEENFLSDLDHGHEIIAKFDDLVISRISEQRLVQDKELELSDRVSRGSNSSAAPTSVHSEISALTSRTDSCRTTASGSEPGVQGAMEKHVQFHLTSQQQAREEVRSTWIGQNNNRPPPASIRDRAPAPPAPIGALISRVILRHLPCVATSAMRIVD